VQTYPRQITLRRVPKDRRAGRESVVAGAAVGIESEEEVDAEVIVLRVGDAVVGEGVEEFV